MRWKANVARTWGENIGYWVEAEKSLKERDHFEYLGVNWRIILKLPLTKQGRKVWTRWNWLWIGWSSRQLWKIRQNQPPGSINHCHRATTQLQLINTGCFIMFSVITNIYNKKTKRPTLMELFTATGKLKKFFFLTTNDFRCVHHEWHGTHRYDIQVLATHASTWVLSDCTDIQLFIRRTNGLVCGRFLCILRTKRTLHSNHRLTVWYSNTQNDLFPGAAIFSLHNLASPSGRNVNYDEKQFTGKTIFELFLLSIQVS